MPSLAHPGSGSAPFQWDNRYLTGLSDIDAQHQHFVMLINAVSSKLSSGDWISQDIDHLLHQLAEDVRHHFKEEEALMSTVGLDDRHQDKHVFLHRGFLQEMRQRLNDTDLSDPARFRNLLEFFMLWYGNHLLVTDRFMARQVKAIGQGASAAAAFANFEPAEDGRADPALADFTGYLSMQASYHLEIERLQRKLEDRETRYESLVNNCNDIIWRITPDGVITYVSPSVKQITGYEPEEIIGTTIMDKIAGGKNQKTANKLLSQRLEGEFGATPIAYELKFQRKDGSPYIAEVRSSPILGEFGQIIEIQGTNRDITKRKEMQDALESSEQQFRSLVESAPIGILLVDDKGLISVANPEVARIFGYQQKEMIGQNIDVLLDPEVSAIHRIHQRRYFDHPETKTMGSGRNLPGRHKDGHSLQLEIALNMLATPQGKMVQVTVIDITGRKRIEDELQKMEKLESIAVLAGGIAHDLNNHLLAIVGHLSLAKLTEDRAAMIEYMDETERAALRLKDLTYQLLTFAKGGAPILSEGRIDNLIRDTTTFSLHGSNVTAQFDISDDLWSCVHDQGQFAQVINNLIINAQQAMPSGGNIQITTENIVIDAKSSLPLSAGTYVKISVRDAGVGIPADLLPYVFDPFYTTKEKGSGLGLATCYSIIRNHEGLLAVESKINQGTRFDVYLPAVESHGERSPHSLDTPPIDGTGRILVMDDDEAIRRLLVRMLTRLGFDAVTSGDGNEALELYREALSSAEPFRAVLLDLTIPGGMGGLETIGKLTELDPQVTAVVSSGYSENAVMADLDHHGFKGMIAKPYNMADLSKVLGQVLNAKVH